MRIGRSVDVCGSQLKVAVLLRGFQKPCSGEKIVEKSKICIRKSIQGWVLIPISENSISFLNDIYCFDDWKKAKPSERAFLKGEPIDKVKAEIKDVCKGKGIRVSFCGNKHAPTIRLWRGHPLKEMKQMKLVQALSNELGADSLWQIYRRIYKGTGCGPSIGFQIASPDNDPFWSYCDDLGKLGLLEEMKAKGQVVVGISVSSIVEGSDAEVSGDTLHGAATKKQFWQLLENVDKEASFLWERDNSDWYCLKSPEDEKWSFQNTSGEIKWNDDEDDMPPKEIVAAVEKFIDDGGNMTWDGSWGSKTHKYDEYFPLANTDWTVCEYINDCCW
jgi:hypothetical protein